MAVPKPQKLVVGMAVYRQDRLKDYTSNPMSVFSFVTVYVHVPYMHKISCPTYT